jgi:Raf kinase inhibitor-like YbhB/YbcL family protein
MQITSPIFQNGETVPLPYTCNGPNQNPPLQFHDVPPDAQSLVLTVEDADAPAMPWVHWLVFNIPATTTQTFANSIPIGGVEGLANGGTFGYEGPCPKYFLGTHHYHFHLYALDTMLDLPPQSDRKAVLAAMEGHVLAHAVMIGLAEGDGSAL